MCFFSIYFFSRLSAWSLLGLIDAFSGSQRLSSQSRVLQLIPDPSMPSAHRYSALDSSWFD